MEATPKDIHQLREESSRARGMLASKARSESLAWGRGGRREGGDGRGDGGRGDVEKGQGERAKEEKENRSKSVRKSWMGGFRCAIVMSRKVC